MKISIGFSPCPNDTFIFDALVNGLIDTGDLELDVHLQDVETLNQWAVEGRLDVTKLSYGVLPEALKQYVVLNRGSALGRGVGPLLISSGNIDPLQVEEQPVAIPGRHTTAHLLFSLAYPSAQQKVFLRYDEIEQFVMDGKGLGVIIHENRFTYKHKGLMKVTDLGDFWEKETGNPIPLGGIAVRREIDVTVARMVDDLIGASLEYAWGRYPVLSDYIRMYAQEMSEDVMRKHIDLYVNEYSLDLGDGGRSAVQKLLSVYREVNHINDGWPPVFIRS